VTATGSFSNPVAIRFGEDALEGIGRSVGLRRAVIVTTPGMDRRGTPDEVEGMLEQPVVARYAEVGPNPTIGSCTDAFEAIRDSAPEVIIALGGGSVIDTAKAVAAQLGGQSGSGWLAAHLRSSEPFPAPFDPPAIIAIPTTAGTGSEVTMWGTIWDEESREKRSISHERLYPEAALLQPSLTHSVPRETTVASALDALSHAMEAIWNRAANPVSGAVAVRAIRLIPRALRRVLDAPADADARGMLVEGSLLAGLAISNTRTALAHSISYPLTAELGLPHGVAASITLPEILTAVERGAPDRARLIVDAIGSGSVSEAVAELRELFGAAGIAEIVRRHIPTAQHLDALRTGFIAPGRAENFVLPMDQDAASALLRRAYRAVVG
jgi:alcohol dehydrogenase